MADRRHFRALVLMGLITASASFLSLVISFQKRPDLTNLNQTPYSLNEVSKDVVAASFAHKTPYTVDPEARVLLVPHHLVAGREVASLISSTPAPRRVLLLSPDHFSQSTWALSTTLRPFLWNDTVVLPDRRLSDQLRRSLPTTLHLQDNVFEREHGVRSLVPYFAEAWLGVQVNAITVRVDSAPDTIDQLAEALHNILNNDPDLLIVITIDFSHELPAYLADLHDTHALQELLTQNSEASTRVEIDSPPLFRLVTTLTKLQQRSLMLHAHTNSLRLMRATVTELGTSHILMSDAPLNTSTTTSTTTFTFIHDPARHIVSSEERAYRGYTDVTTSTIPFPAVFVREQTSTSTRWHALPLKKTEGLHWKLVSDQEFEQRLSQRKIWETWATLHLSKTSGE